MSTHLFFFNSFFLTLKIYQNHFIMGIFFFLIAKVTKFLTRLPFFTVFVLTILLVP